MLEIKDLRTLHGRKIEALRGVSLSVASGEIVALIGGNGAGKSTLLTFDRRSCCRRIRGKSTFQGQSVVRKPSHRVAALGIVYVPEGRRVFPRLTVQENLEMGAFLRRDRSSIAEDQWSGCFRLFLTCAQTRQNQMGAPRLSGGEQQMLADRPRADGASPKLLMLDEPSMGLAPLMVEKIFAVIQEIHRQGMTLLMVEQNARKAPTNCTACLCTWKQVRLF